MGGVEGGGVRGGERGGGGGQTGVGKGAEGKQKVAGSRGRPTWTQGLFVKKPCVLMCSDGAAGSPKHNKQSAKENKRSELSVNNFGRFFSACCCVSFFPSC